MFSRKRILIKYISKTPEKYLNSNIQLSGWVNSIRIQGAKSFGFLVLNDGSCLDSLQIILKSSGEEDTKFDNILCFFTLSTSKMNNRIIDPLKD